ncbi:energy transducer TonB [Marinigracilibium pacificum]|uniref:TonB C-terminal domain-containing protein n=1 Tax=Marinigracilibium pacificum TaxID=2729599 RepID=A0A848IYF5_9BACT|nr:energy transducer TonB [Marinigracilibium pacificum]NMM48666.1 hypothetical protein [Marinigracilibium pacificum]
MKKLLYHLIFTSAAFIACEDPTEKFSSERKIESIEEVNSDHFTCILIESQPEFPGGMDAYYDYLKEKTNSITLNKKCIEGRIYIQFTVEKDGAITEVNVLKGIDKEIEEKAKSIVSGFPKWIPGKLGNKIVRSKMIIPIYFN